MHGDTTQLENPASKMNMGDPVESNNKLFAVMAWLQLAIGVLLAASMMWGYINYKASVGLT